MRSTFIPLPTCFLVMDLSSEHVQQALPSPFPMASFLGLVLPTDSCSAAYYLAQRYVMHRSRPRVPCHPDGDDDRYRNNCQASRPTRADLILADRSLAASTALGSNSPARESEPRAPIEGCRLDSGHHQLDQADSLTKYKVAVIACLLKSPTYSFWYHPCGWPHRRRMGDDSVIHQS
ncbi:hypothetical protein IQ07DRAFT_173921 [Pyrenochaeta sp. DS3sAY3a]|nr:hypothetical protein IQ07DRAFT_173921 [Pyrenochaeta sp. DS3sAY3a]